MLTIQELHRVSMTKPTRPLPDTMMDQYNLVDLCAVDQNSTGPSSTLHKSETDWAPMLPDTLSSNKSTSIVSSPDSSSVGMPHARIARSSNSNSAISGESRLQLDAELFIQDRLYITPSPSPPSFFSDRPGHALASISSTLASLASRNAFQIDHISRLMPSPTSTRWSATSRGSMPPTDGVIEDIAEHQWGIEESWGSGGASLGQPQRTSPPLLPYTYKNGLLVAFPGEVQGPEIAYKSVAVPIESGLGQDKKKDREEAKDRPSGSKWRASTANQAGVYKVKKEATASDPAPQPDGASMVATIQFAGLPDKPVNEGEKNQETRGNDRQETIEGGSPFSHRSFAIPSNKSCTSKLRELEPQLTVRSASLLSIGELDRTAKSSSGAIFESSDGSVPTPAALITSPSKIDPVAPLIIASPTSHTGLSSNESTTSLLADFQGRYDKLKEAYRNLMDSFEKDISRLSQIAFK